MLDFQNFHEDMNSEKNERNLTKTKECTYLREILHSASQELCCF